MRCQLDYSAGGIVLSFDGGGNCSYGCRAYPVDEKTKQSNPFFFGLDGCFYDRILFRVNDFQRKYFFLLIGKKKGSSKLSFGENLRRARKNAGITQTELAHSVGITERSLYNYEQNSRAPKIDVVKKFADVLGVNPEMLLAGDSAELWQTTRQSRSKLLLQIQFIFDSDLDLLQKEQFFEEITQAYFHRKKENE